MIGTIILSIYLFIDLLIYFLYIFPFFRDQQDLCS